MTDESKTPAPLAGKCPVNHTAAAAATESGASSAPSSYMSDLLAAHGDDHDTHDLDPIATAFSTYSSALPLNKEERGARSAPLTLYRLRRNEMWPTEQDDHVEPWAQTVHDMLRGHIGGPYFPCLGARASMAERTYRVGYYRNLAHPSSVSAMARDLRRFVNEYEQIAAPETGFTSFISLFKYPQCTSEDEFEKLLFSHLQQLHEYDNSAWDPLYSADPAEGHFAFSFGGKAFFIVGMHAGASRLSRLLPRPALIFNPESQIQRLKREGHLLHFAQSVRKRDVRYQGNFNPSLPADPNSSGGEANVYSGKHHASGDGWKCPFAPRPELLKPSDKKSGD
jgi:FPC/CPF motif-containing protein YcgG